MSTQLMTSRAVNNKLDILAQGPQGLNSRLAVLRADVVKSAVKSPKARSMLDKAASGQPFITTQEAARQLYELMRKLPKKKKDAIISKFLWMAASKEGKKTILDRTVVLRFLNIFTSVVLGAGVGVALTFITPIGWILLGLGMMALKSGSIAAWFYFMAMPIFTGALSYIYSAVGFNRYNARINREQLHRIANTDAKLHAISQAAAKVLTHPKLVSSELSKKQWEIIKKAVEKAEKKNKYTTKSA